MKTIDMVADASKNYIHRKLAYEVDYRKKIEETKPYNDVIKSKMMQEIEDNYITEKARLRELYEDAKKASASLMEGFLSKKYTLPLSPEDTATFNNLERINFSENELRVYLEKYKSNPMAIRRLKYITEKKGMALKKEIIDTAWDYDFYLNEYNDYITFCDNTIAEIDMLDPTRQIEGTDSILVEICLAGLDQQKEKINKIFAKIEEGTANE